MYQMLWPSRYRDISLDKWTRSIAAGKDSGKAPICKDAILNKIGQ